MSITKFTQFISNIELSFVFAIDIFFFINQVTITDL